MMLEELRTIFADALGRPMPPFTPELAFANLPGWDSVAHLALLLSVEQRMGVAFTAAEMVSMQTVGDLMAAVGARHA